MENDAEIERWCAWLAQVWAKPAVAEAITIASPALAARVEAVCQGQRPRARQVRRMVMSLARYLARMRGRATPFGGFAGVAPLRFSEDASARWSTRQYARTSADAVWLAGVIARLESCPALRCRLQVMVNDLVFVRGERVVAPWQPHAGNPGRSASAEISVRNSPAVQTVLHAAQTPIRAGALIDKVAAEIPDVSHSAIDAMLAELMARGVLISSLHPPSTSADGLAHVLDQLQQLEADGLEEAAPLIEELSTIRAQLEGVNCSTRWAGGQTRRETADRMRALSDVVEQPLMMDLRLGSAVVLPRQVAVEAESAAGALLRLTPHPAGHPPWRDYHRRFLARYGAGALVPVGQLVDPTAGLGFPSHYAEPRRATPPMEIRRRDERLLVLAQQAALDGSQEIVLDDDALEALAADGLDGTGPSTHVELLADVRAPTMAALAEGAFTLVVNGVGRTAVAMTGRFLDILSDADRQRMVDLYGRLPVGVDGAIQAQLSFPPKSPRLENVARAPLLLPDMITLAEYRDGAQGRILVQDLAVTTDKHRLYLVSLSRRQVVEPIVTNAAALRAMPPIARLLFEIPRARTAAVSPFAWGAAKSLPFLPRIRYGRAVLAPARWRVPAGELPGPDAPWSVWESAMAVVRDRRRLPPSVHVGTADRRLRLDLDKPMDLALLRAHVEAAGETVTMFEAPIASDHGWFAGRAHEILIPLAAATPPAPAPAVVTFPGPLPPIVREQAILPGSKVLFAKLYGHPDGFDTILTGHLPALLSAWEDPPTWWFVRYRDPAPHLRLRLNLTAVHDYGQVAVQIGEWAAELRRRGLIGDLTLNTYHPETARYGSGASMAAAETLFAADSAAVLAQLAALAHSRREVRPHALTAASLVDLASAMTGGLSSGMGWLIDQEQTDQVPAPERGLVRQAVSLADVAGDEALANISGGPRIAVAWRARREAAATYAGRLTADTAQVRTTPVVASLLHMHHVRAHGIDPDSERLCRRLARAIALAWTARRTQAERGAK